MRLALFQPDQPGNTGTLIRLAACLSVGIDIIEPCGFPFSSAALKRAGLDYVPQALISHHPSYQAFQAARQGRLVLLTTKAAIAYTSFTFLSDDVLMLGQESAGVPPAVHDEADARLTIPMAPGLRSINVAMAGAMVLGEALRQTAGFVKLGTEFGEE
jgi:tRNA (cytidine/uridine-2'-O-)-methyltransferase